MMMLNPPILIEHNNDSIVNGTLLEILSYATNMFATGMQLLVACNYARFFMQLKWIFAPFLGVYATMVQL
jgi:hypothetical protein